MSKRIPTKLNEQEKINVRERLTDNVLDLSLMNISVVPVNEIKSLKRATVLDLSNNVLTTINTDFASLVQLTKLDLSNNKIRLISDNFGNLVNLRHLDLYNNQIERLPLSFGRLKKLKYLDLKNNRLNPVFAKVIGTCTDHKDCIEAAKKAVAFMTDIEQQVLEERRREKEKQRELELQQEQEKALQEAKQSTKSNPEKKKKNKHKKSKAENLNPVNNQQDDGAVSDKDTEKEIKETHSPTNDKTSSCKGTVMCLLLTVLVLVILFVGVLTIKPELFDVLLGKSNMEILEEYIK